MVHKLQKKEQHFPSLSGGQLQVARQEGQLIDLILPLHRQTVCIRLCG